MSLPNEKFSRDYQGLVQYAKKTGYISTDGEPTNLLSVWNHIVATVPNLGHLLGSDPNPNILPSDIREQLNTLTKNYVDGGDGTVYLPEGTVDDATIPTPSVLSTVESVANTVVEAVVPEVAAVEEAAPVVEAAVSEAVAAVAPLSSPVEETPVSEADVATTQPSEEPSTETTTEGANTYSDSTQPTIAEAQPIISATNIRSN